MKTYKEYYQIGLDEHLDWKSNQKDEWWRAKQNKDELDLKGEYLETITPLSEEEKNQVSHRGNALRLMKEELKKYANINR